MNKMKWNKFEDGWNWVSQGYYLKKKKMNKKK